MRTLLTLFAFLAAVAVFAQSSVKPSELVKQAHADDERFTKISMFDMSTNRSTIDEAIEVYDLLDIDRVVLQSVRLQGPENMTLVIPSQTRNVDVEVELVKVDIFTPDFQVTLGSTGRATEVELGTHYRGIVKGDEHSVVSFSFFEHEVMGLVATHEGNFVLGKLQGTDWDGEHIFYNDKDLLEDFAFDCATPDDDFKGYAKHQLTLDTDRAPGDCIRMYNEVDHDIHNNKGGVTGATNYITGLLNEVITLYAAEGITTVISEILVWDVPSPYSSTSSSGMLSDFQAATGAFNGDLGHLFSYQASGGIAAGFSGICNSNPDNSKCFSSIDATYSAVPTYSWSVMVTTHELGHLWGSRHTHACVWNGNNTAIDGCAGSTEGSCPNPGNPPNSVGGTIMSYCHLTSAGINLNNGFGPQPSAVINSSVNNATCTTTCGPPTCSDGIQNGNETGVDCGGPDCAACPPCDDVTLTIVLDNYPGETSWTITSGGTTWGSGSGYTGAGSTVVETVCLPTGCYDLNMFDSYGDGICCAYGNGSYQLQDASGTVVASGGAFGTSETTNFCVTVGGGGGDTQAPTTPTNLNAFGPTTSSIQLSWNASSDNVGVDGYNVYMNGSLLGTVAGTGANVTGLAENTTYSFYVTAFDAAGNTSGASNTDSETTLSSGGGGCTAGVVDTESFETGWGIWNDGGGDCTRRNEPARSWDGNYSIRIRDNSGTASSMTTDALDLSDYSSVDVEFYFYPNSMENGEDFWLRVNNGSGWSTAAVYTSGSSFNNNSFYTATVNFPAASISANTQFRFQCDASANADRIYIDLVTITGNCSAMLESNEITSTITELKTPTRPAEIGEVVQLDLNEVNIYPNPTRELLNIASAEAVESVLIFSANGAQVATFGQVNHNEGINVSNLQPGLYFLSIKTASGVVNKKFIKAE
jgi:hypothetical protein